MAPRGENKSSVGKLESIKTPSSTGWETIKGLLPLLWSMNALSRTQEDVWGQGKTCNALPVARGEN